MRERALSAHLGYLFTELPFAERPAAARRAGFSVVEHPNPQVMPVHELRAILDGEGLEFAQMAVVGADATGSKGVAALPGREPEFRDRLARALDFAEAIGCPLLHPMAGSTEHEAAADASYRANLEHMVDRCRKRPVSVLIEALSRRVLPDYFVDTLGKALVFAEDYGVEEVRVLVDTFHAAENEMSVARFVAEHLDRVGHIHIADHPGRHEPGTGTLDFDALLATLVTSGYRGAIGFEYKPLSSTEGGLSWMESWMRRLNRTSQPTSAGGMP